MPPPPAPASAGITAASPQAPTAINLPATPTYDPAAAMGAIRQFYQIPQEAAGKAMATKAAAYNAKTAIDQQTQSLEAQKNLTDPSKYHVINDPTGANPTRIIDPTGKQISVADMVKATGTAPVDVLKNSENAQEKQFVEAYQNYEGFMKALLNNDTKTLQQYYQNNQGLQSMKPEDVRKLFMSQYGDYFGIPQQNVPYGVNRGFIPGSTSSPSGASFHFDPTSGKFVAG